LAVDLVRRRTLARFLVAITLHGPCRWRTAEMTKKSPPNREPKTDAEARELGFIVAEPHVDEPEEEGEPITSQDNRTRTPDGLPELEGLFVVDANEPKDFIEHVLTYPFRKVPKSDTFWRVHPEHRATVRMVESQDEIDGHYVVHERIWKAVPELRSKAAKAKICDLYLATSLQGAVIVWFAQRHDGVGKVPASIATRVEAIERAKTQWTQVFWDGSSGYRTRTPVDAQDEPTWPDEPFAVIVHKAVKDVFIDTLDHPYVKKIRGER
jgi:hypothetical protein